MQENSIQHDTTVENTTNAKSYRKKGGITFHRFIHHVTSPWFFLFWLTLMIACYLYVDKDVAMYFKNHTMPLVSEWAHWLTKLGESLFYLAALSIFFLIARFIMRKDTLAKKILFVLSAMAVSGISSFVIKVLLARARPHLLFTHGVYGFEFLQLHAKMWSFPSGHTTAIAALMFALCYLLPRYWMYFITIMFTVAATRVIITAHYLSDVLAGMYLSALMVTLVARYLKPERKGYVASN